MTAIQRKFKFWPCILRLALIMPAPASPKPTRRRDVIFSNVLSSSLISYSPVRQNQNVILCFISFYFVKFYSFYFILFYFILFYFILFYFIPYHFILFYFILFYFILFHFILFYFILFYFILSYFIFYLFYFISFHYILFRKSIMWYCMLHWVLFSLINGKKLSRHIISFNMMYYHIKWYNIVIIYIDYLL